MFIFLLPCKKKNFYGTLHQIYVQFGQKTKISFNNSKLSYTIQLLRNINVVDEKLNKIEPINK